MKRLAPPALAAIFVLAGCGGSPHVARNLTLRDVEASVRAVRLTYIVIPGATIVQANSRGQNPRIWVNIRLFANASAVARSSVIATARRYFPRSHSEDITVCNAWVAPLTVRLGGDGAPLPVNVRAVRQIAAALRDRCETR